MDSAMASEWLTGVGSSSTERFQPNIPKSRGPLTFSYLQLIDDNAAAGTTAAENREHTDIFQPNNSVEYVDVSQKPQAASSEILSKNSEEPPIAVKSTTAKVATAESTKSFTSTATSATSAALPAPTIEVTSVTVATSVSDATNDSSYFDPASIAEIKKTVKNNVDEKFAERRLEEFLKKAAAEAVDGAASGVQNTEGGVRNKEGGAKNTEGGVMNKEGGAKITEGGVKNKKGGVKNTEGEVKNKEGGVKNTEGGVKNEVGGVKNTERGVKNKEGGVKIAEGAVSIEATGNEFGNAGNSVKGKKTNVKEKIKDDKSDRAPGKKAAQSGGKSAQQRDGHGANDVSTNKKGKNPSAKKPPSRVQPISDDEDISSFDDSDVESNGREDLHGNQHALHHDHHHGDGEVCEVEHDSDSLADYKDKLSLESKAKQSRSEKKARKAIVKLGLKSVRGICQVAMRRNKNVLFLINQPEVFHNPKSDIYVIFGEAKIEDLEEKAKASALEKFKSRVPFSADSNPTTAPSTVSENNITTDEYDETGLESNDIELVVLQTGVSRSVAAKALRENNCDIVNAIMELTT